MPWSLLYPEECGEVGMLKVKPIRVNNNNMGKEKYTDQDRQRPGQRVRELDERIKASEGFRVRNKIRNLQNSYNIFSGNHMNLISVLNDYEKPEVFVPSLSEDRREDLSAFLGEVMRIFDNYLAGAGTLVDHTRVFTVEMYEATPFEAEYQRRKDERLKSSPIVQFVQRLRNYMLHTALPVTSTNVRFERTKVGEKRFNLDPSIKLEVNELRLGTVGQ
jgi:hypothetical protein